MGQREVLEGESADDADPDVMLTYSASEALKGKAVRKPVKVDDKSKKADGSDVDLSDLEADLEGDRAPVPRRCATGDACGNGDD